MQSSYMVDTGAAVTLLDSLGQGEHDRTSVEQLDRTPGVDGTHLETWGTATAEIAFAGETF